jgi:hypothetical protein
LDLWLRLKTVAEVCAGFISFMDFLDPINDDSATAKGHLSVDRHGFVADQQPVVPFTIDHDAVDVAKLAGINRLCLRLAAIQQFVKQCEPSHVSALPDQAALESGEIMRNAMIGR